MKTLTKVAAATALVLAASLTGVAAADAAPPPASRHSGTVVSFNDGFATAKQDDCWQGFKPACAWLKSVGVKSLTSPAWLHVQAAPHRVALAACGRWPQFGMGSSKRGQVVPGVEVRAVGSRGVQTTDGLVYCQSGKVAGP